MPLASVVIFVFGSVASVALAVTTGPIGAGLGAAITLTALLWTALAPGLALSILKARQLTDASCETSMERMFLGDAKMLAKSAGVEGVRFALVESPVPMACSIGDTGDGRFVILSTGLFKTVTRMEIAAITGRELGHIKSGRSTWTALHLTLARIFPVFPTAGLSMSERAHGRADAFAVDLCENASVLASALKKLERAAWSVQWKGPAALPAKIGVSVINPTRLKVNSETKAPATMANRLAELYRQLPV